MIFVTDHISLDESELGWEFVRSSGPGGQNVTKVATAGQLRCNVAASPRVSDEVKRRVRQIAGGRMTSEGVLIITAQRFRYRRGTVRTAAPHRNYPPGASPRNEGSDRPRSR